MEITLSKYLKSKSVTCSVKEFIESSPKSRTTIEKYFKSERQMIDAYIEEWKARKRFSINEGKDNE